MVMSRARFTLWILPLIALGACSSASTTSKNRPKRATGSLVDGRHAANTEMIGGNSTIAPVAPSALPRGLPAPTDATSGTPAAWPSALHDARHSGSANVLGPTTGNVRWQRKLDGDITPGPVVAADGTVYQATNAGTLYAIDSVTGRQRWKFSTGISYGNDLSTSPIILASGVVVWPGPNASLWGIDPNGSLRWKFAGDAMFTSPQRSGDRLYAMDTSGMLHAFVISGDSHLNPMWSLAVGPGSYASVAISPNGDLVTTAGNSVVVVRDRGRFGEVRWRHDLATIIEISAAVAADGSIVTGGNDQWMWIFSADGAHWHRYSREVESYSSPIVTESGTALQGNHIAAVIARDLARGTLQFLDRRIPKGRPNIQVWTSPVVDRSYHVYFATRAGVIVGYDWSGRLIFELDAGPTASFDTYPALTGDGALIIGDTEGMLRAIADH